MNPGAPSRMIAAIFALAAFVVAVVAGLGAGNPASRVLVVAITGLVVCYVLGSVAGAIGEWVVSEHVRAPLRAKTPAAEKVPATGAKSAPAS